MRQFSCPKCGEAMLESEEVGLPHDECFGCSGRWHDHLALDALLQKRVPGRDLGGTAEFMTRDTSEATSWSCPCCLEPLLASEHAGIRVEWCPSCNGLYLDLQELERLVGWRRANLGLERRRTAEAAAEGVVDWLLFDGLGDTLRGWFRRHR